MINKLNIDDKGKFIGAVKWFHDSTRNANYGFIQHVTLGDLYFNENSIESGQDLSAFKENEIVVFTPKNSTKHVGKYEALHVKLLKFETDLVFLFGHFLSVLLEKGKYLDYIIIQTAVHSRITLLLKDQEDTQIRKLLFHTFQTFVNNQVQSAKAPDFIFLKGLLNVCKSFFPDQYLDVSKTIVENIPTQTVHQLWLEDYVEACQVDFITTFILKENAQLQHKILKKCTKEDRDTILLSSISTLDPINTTTNIKEIKDLLDLVKEYGVDQQDKQINIILFDIYQKFVNEQVQSENIPDIVILKSLLNICKSFFPEQYLDVSKTIESKISPSTAHQLWLEDYIRDCQVDHILTIILHENSVLQHKILNKCSKEDRTTIFLRCISMLGPIDSTSKFKEIKALLKLSEAYSADLQHDHILQVSLSICSVKYKLILWLEDYHQELDYYKFKTIVPLLIPSDQVKFVKKVLKYIHESKIHLTVDELTSINVIDYKTSKLEKSSGKEALDYSTSIMLNTILELKNQTQLDNWQQITDAKNRIFNIILNQINDPTDILEIRGYFDECKGRCSSVSSRDLHDDTGDVIDKEVFYHRDTYHIPKYHKICDGRKALKAGNAVIDESTNLEYWWCANNKCFKPSRRLHTHEEWEEYSLLDFLTILKVPFQEKDYEMYLNIINKANRFLEHLKCRECNHILRPTRQSNYAFYGVNHFNCINDSCKNKDVEIYLTHCINSRCEHEIDSRDSVRCKPQGVDVEKYGWYVCNYCHACCTDEGIKKRMYILNKTGQEYKGHTRGHKELGVVSCDKCGNPMEANTVDMELYQKSLDWLIRNANKPNTVIIKTGKTKQNKHWFRYKKLDDVSQEEYCGKLKNLLKLGFHIPDYDEKKDVHLISEPAHLDRRNSDILTCGHCNHILDISNDLERQYAIKKFHNTFS